MKYLPYKHKSDRKDNNSISGQALLLVLLGMAVVLTLVLSVVSRSMTDISLTTRDEESLRAFSAAEAGVERMIVGVGTTGVLDTGTYTGSVSEYGRGAKSVNFPEIESGESITIWFVEHDEATGNLTCDLDNDGTDGDCFKGGDINVCWGNNATPAPAIEVSYYYDTNFGIPAGNALIGDFSGVKVARVAYDSLYQSRDNSFSKPAATACDPIGDVTYEFSTGSGIMTYLLGMDTCLGVQGCLLFAKVKMFYNDDVAHGVGVIVDAPLPSQGRSIESTGSSGDATAKIEAFQSYNEPLDVFESALFSKSALVKKVED